MTDTETTTEPGERPTEQERPTDAGLVTVGVNRKTLSVTGVSCDGCEQNVESALTNVEDAGYDVTA